MVWLTKFVVRSLEFASRHLPSRKPKHLLTGKRGELEAYLYLRAWVTALSRQIFASPMTAAKSI